MIVDPQIKMQRLIARKKSLLEDRHKQLKWELPHLYAFDWYDWAWDFFDNTTDKIQLICAANQISKSSTNIRKAIHWATDTELWPKIWPNHPNPNLMWYLYPSKDVATAEFKKKWVEFMPRGNMKDDPIYGWKVIMDGKHISHIDFNSGMSIYFKTYMQNAMTLQSGSVFAIFCDEELLEHLYDELMFRISGTQGFFHMVFTATIGQHLWFRAMEMTGTRDEFLPNAFKQTISMYDCLKYKNGKESPWTVERIKEVEERCKNKAEVMRRVHGRFVKTEGRLVHAFDPAEHYIDPFPIPVDWCRYVGVDIGSGGETGHPSAITFVAVKPDYSFGVVYKGWRGDNIQTTSGDVFNKYQEMKEPNEGFTRKVYDFSAADFKTTSQRAGEPFDPANKSREEGFDLLNTLFKYGMLKLFREDDEIRKLGGECISVLEATAKTQRKDDFIDSARYTIIEVPWDLSKVMAKDKKTLVRKEKMPTDIMELTIYNLEAQRNGTYKRPWDDDPEETIDYGELAGEFMEMNELYGN